MVLNFTNIDSEKDVADHFSNLEAVKTIDNQILSSDESRQHPEEVLENLSKNSTINLQPARNDELSQELEGVMDGCHSEKNVSNYITVKYELENNDNVSQEPDPRFHSTESISNFHTIITINTEQTEEKLKLKIEQCTQKNCCCFFNNTLCTCITNIYFSKKEQDKIAKHPCQTRLNNYLLNGKNV